jgi:hypothetical protein
MQPSNHQLILQYSGIMFCRGILRGVNKNRDEFECLDSFGGLLSGAIGRFRWGHRQKAGRDTDRPLSGELSSGSKNLMLQ